MSLKRKDRPQSIPELLAILDEPHPKPLSNRKQGLGCFIIALLVIGIFVAKVFFDLRLSSPTIEYSLDNDTAENYEAAEDFSDQTFTVNGVSFTMVAVEGGTFTMGATAEQGEDALDDEKPAHSVTLSSYFIGQTEVTQALWKAVMGSNLSYHKGNNLPVENVSWNDCQDFIRRLNQLTGKKFRLPTEAEWEYAARGGNKSQGYIYAGSNAIDEVAWYGGNCDYSTHTVATKQANELGLYDMSGNVFEWCQDWYGNYSSGSQTNPTGPISGSERVCRGGFMYISAYYCRLSNRLCEDPSDRYDATGFRLALSE